MSTTIDNEQNVDADDYFLLAAAVWNSQTEDYPDAEQSFQDGGLSAFPELKGKDIKLDLIHVRFGINRFLLSRIVI